MINVLNASSLLRKKAKLSIQILRIGTLRVKRFGPPGTFEDTSGRDDFGGSMGWNLRTEGVRLADVDMVTPVVYRDPLFRFAFCQIINSATKVV